MRRAAHAVHAGKETSLPIVIQCKICGKTMRLPPSTYARGRRYCSVKCSVDAGTHAGGKTHGMSTSRLHQLWCNMKGRCQRHPDYAGRGISVCPEWAGSFEEFAAWALSTGYKEGLELDRKNTNGNYEPSNCRWATRTEQMRNTRKRKNAQTSIYKGVSWHTNCGKWVVQLGVRGGVRYLGLFVNEIEAAKRYDAAAREVFGEFAAVNFPTGNSKEASCSS